MFRLASSFSMSPQNGLISASSFSTYQHKHVAAGLNGMWTANEKQCCVVQTTDPVTAWSWPAPLTGGCHADFVYYYNLLPKCQTLGILVLTPVVTFNNHVESGWITQEQVNVFFFCKSNVTLLISWSAEQTVAWIAWSIRKQTNKTLLKHSKENVFNQETNYFRIVKKTDYCNDN